MFSDSMATESKPGLLTVDETAKTLRVTIGTVRKLIADGELRATKVGSVVRIRQQWVDDYIDRDSSML